MIDFCNFNFSLGKPNENSWLQDFVVLSFLRKRSFLVEILYSKRATDSGLSERKNCRRQHHLFAAKEANTPINERKINIFENKHRGRCRILKIDFLKFKMTPRIWLCLKRNYTRAISMLFSRQKELNKL